MACVPRCRTGQRKVQACKPRVNPTFPRTQSVLWATGWRWNVSLSSSLMKRLSERSSGFQACWCWISGPAGGMSNSSSRRAGNWTPRLRSDTHPGGYASSLVSGSSADFTTPDTLCPITAQPRASTTTAGVTSWAGWTGERQPIRRDDTVPCARSRRPERSGQHCRVKWKRVRKLVVDF